MFSIFWFLGGLAGGLAVGFVFRRNWIRINKRLSEQKNQLAQEKKMAVEFMHNLAEAIGEGVERKVLYQRIVHTAVITTGAMSACIYEKLPMVVKRCCGRRTFHLSELSN